MESSANLSENTLKCEICEKIFSTRKKTATLELFTENSKIMPRKSNEFSNVLLAEAPTQDQVF